MKTSTAIVAAAVLPLAAFFFFDRSPAPEDTPVAETGAIAQSPESGDEGATVPEDTPRADTNPESVSSVSEQEAQMASDDPSSGDAGDGRYQPAEDGRFDEQGYPTTEEIRREFHHAFATDRSAMRAFFDSVFETEAGEMARDRYTEQRIMKELEAGIASGKLKPSAVDSISELICYPAVCTVLYDAGLEESPIVMRYIYDIGFTYAYLTEDVKEIPGGVMVYVITENIAFYMREATPEGSH